MEETVTLNTLFPKRGRRPMTDMKKTGIILPLSLHTWAKRQAITDSSNLGRHIGFNDLVIEGLKRVKQARAEGKGPDDI